MEKRKIAVVVSNKNQDVGVIETINAIQKAGFKNVFIQWYNRDWNPNQKKQLKYIKEKGLHVVFAHLDYFYPDERNRTSMNYVIGDIHNDNRRFSRMLEKIDFSEEDHLFLLGDLFDRNPYKPDPIGVYFNVLKLGNRCTVIRGNHDVWLAEYIIHYFNTPERKRKRLAAYSYNSFAIFSEHFTEVDMLDLAKRIAEWPLQICVEVDGVKYLLAHACTSSPDRVMRDEFYLMADDFMGKESYEAFLCDGRKGYISVCGHANIMGNGKIWKSKLKNVYMCDCGCGFRNGRLGCLCLETKEEIYV